MKTTSITKFFISIKLTMLQNFFVIIFQSTLDFEKLFILSIQIYKAKTKLYIIVVIGRTSHK